MKIKLKYLVLGFVTIFLVALLVYIIYPKPLIDYQPGTGSWISGQTVTVCKCYGYSQNIANKWLDNYSSNGNNPTYKLTGKDSCIGVLTGCLITNVEIDFDFYQNN